MSCITKLDPLDPTDRTRTEYVTLTLLKCLKKMNAISQPDPLAIEELYYFSFRMQRSYLAKAKQKKD